MKTPLAFTTAVVVLTLAACAQPIVPRSAPDSTPAPVMVVPPPPQVATVVSTDAWVGQWNGPEGTFLRIAGEKGRYEVSIQDLDGLRRYPGRAAGDRIEFERNGTIESLRPTRGAETGMKWLSEKKNCLTVRSGEGYCRD